MPRFARLFGLVPGSAKKPALCADIFFLVGSLCSRRPTLHLRSARPSVSGLPATQPGAQVFDFPRFEPEKPLFGCGPLSACLILGLASKTSLNARLVHPPSSRHADSGPHPKTYVREKLREGKPVGDRQRTPGELPCSVHQGQAALGGALRAALTPCPEKLFGLASPMGRSAHRPRLKRKKGGRQRKYTSTIATRK